MIICIIQARMGSTRLPGKVLMELCGDTLLSHLIRRVRKSKLVEKTVIATTEEGGDDCIEALGRKLGIDVFRGSANDVLDRYYQCAKRFKGDTIVRVTGDCPLMDPITIDKTIGAFLTGKYDYVSNAYPTPTYPDGLDVEVFSFKSLEDAWLNASLPSEREHVTAYLWKNLKGDFRLGQVRNSRDLSKKRWTVDEPEDMLFVRKVFDSLYHENPDFGMDEILKFLSEKPEVENLNRTIMRNEGYQRSLKEDGEPR